MKNFLKKWLRKPSYTIGLICLVLVLANISVKADKGNGLSYNYAAIKPHPRLLLCEGEEELIKESISKYPEFKIINEYIIAISDSLINVPALTYIKKGKRLLAVSRKALTRIYYLSYSYRLTGDKQYLKRAEKELNAVCSFKNWNPSHFLDVGEMCMAVAIGYDWLYDDLEKSTRGKIRDAIKEKAFKPSFNNKYNWFLRRVNNWNSVCNAGLVFGALAIMEDDNEVAIPIIERALESNKLPLKVYAPDGNYPEGPGYWNYGTTFQVMLIAALESALGSDNSLSTAPGFMRSADYMLFVGGPSGNYFNYYDCGSEQTALSSMFWFAHKLDNPTLLYQEIKHIRSGVYTHEALSDIERILPNSLVFGKNIDLSKVTQPTEMIYAGKGITPVVIARSNWDNTNAKYFGIKGGSASDDHAHMDQGTFVFDIGNIRWAMDFGLQSYITLESKGVDLWNLKQNSQRWDVFRYNNLNHNTITINNQRHNVNGHAKVIKTYKEGELGAMVDLTDALNLNNELKRATRKATLVNGAFLKIEDVIETNKQPVQVRWNMVTPSSAKIIDRETIKLVQKGKTIFLKIASSSTYKLAIRPAENPSDYKCEYGGYKYGAYNLPNKGVVMVGFDATVAGSSKATFKVIITETNEY